MRSKKNMRDWTNLPQEMVTLISNKVSSYAMYVRLRSVCKMWRRVLSPNAPRLPNQFPWLMFPRPHREDIPDSEVDESQLSFYDPSQRKTHHFEFPFLRGKDIIGSYYGWLVLKCDDRVSLLNPITGGFMDLPSLERIHNRMWRNPLRVEPHGHCMEKVVLSCNPSDPECIVVSCSPLSSPEWELIFCRMGDTHWTGLKPRDESKHLLDFTYHNNSIYTVNHKREVSCYDLRTLAGWTYPSNIKYNSTRDCINLVWGDGECSGLLVVNSCQSYDEERVLRIDVYKWCDSRSQWHRVKDIGKCVLFLNHSNCTQLSNDGELGNGIYYFVRRGFLSFRVGINRFNLKCAGNRCHPASKRMKGSCTIQINPGPLEMFPSGSVDPIWFTPSTI